MAMFGLLLCLIFTFKVTSAETECVRYEVDRSYITNRIVRRSDLDVIPVVNGQPVDVQVSFHILNILDVDVARNEVELLLWMKQSWVEKSFSWVPDCPSNEFNTSFTQVTVPAKEIWTPDITFYKTVKVPEVDTLNLAVVHIDGNVTVVAQTRVRFPCLIQPDKPASVCRLTAGSWTHPSLELTLSVPGEVVDLSEYVESSKFKVQGATQKVSQKKYNIDDSTRDVVELTLTFSSIMNTRRRSLFFLLDT